jgi:hypothetical protein
MWRAGFTTGAHDRDAGPRAIQIFEAAKEG